MKERKPAGAGKIKKLSTRKLNFAREIVKDLAARDPGKIKGGIKPINGPS